MNKYPFTIIRYLAGPVAKTQNHACETIVEAVVRAKELAKLSQTLRVVITVTLYDTGQLHH